MLSKEYGPGPQEEINFFDAAIGASIPSANKLSKDILNDLDPQAYGISWWTSVPVHERILIGDYLYLCANGIELNLAEAKLHYFEWLDAKDQLGRRIEDSISVNSRLEVRFKHPEANAAIDELPSRLERLHLCGFFRAIGSSLDCLGATIIGVLGLRAPLRRADLKSAEQALRVVIDRIDLAAQLQTRFREFFVDLKETVGPQGWLNWTDQYRNMFVHRGRRASYNELVPRDHRLFDFNGQRILRTDRKTYLARFPDRSEIEAMLKDKEMLLNESAESTLNGIFNSCRELANRTCERLQLIWEVRRNHPSLVIQPVDQWKIKIKPSNFSGYEPAIEPFEADQLTINPSLAHRMRAAGVDDAHRHLWDSSVWAD